MKRFFNTVIIFVLLLSICSCGNQSTVENDFDLQVINDLETDIKLPDVKIDTADYNEFLTYLNYNQIECPYNELFGIEAALKEKSSRTFDVSEHTYDFFAGSSCVDAEKLYNVVKSNNKQYMDGVGKHFSKELSASKLKECCEIVADTLNWGIENVEGLDISELGCVLGNLKILRRNSLNSVGTFSDKTNILSVSPDAVKQKKKQTGNSNVFELTISHEAMHILQSRCTDVEQSEDDYFIGTSYSFANLSINPLKTSWLYEASAELNATLKANSSPTTYQYMIDNLESISLATVLNDNVKPRQLEKLCFTQNETALYDQLEFADERKAIEFLYVVELLREKPNDFKKIYEQQYGELKGDYGEFLKKTYNPYFIEVISKLTYKNLAYKLSQNEICLNDVFYIISLYELDLMKDIPFDNDDVKMKYNESYLQYIELQDTFFAILQKQTDVNVVDSFKEYKVNFGEKELYANAKLDWLTNDKRDYILFRNRILYNKSHKPMCLVQ